MTVVTLTQEEVCAAYFWPFPCEQDVILDPRAILHGAGATAVFVDPTGATTAIFPAADRSVSDERLLSVALATGAAINRAVAVQQVADALEDAGEMVLAANRASIGKFVDGLVAVPPTCEPVPVPRALASRTQSTPPPTWEQGEQLSGIDLLGVGVRFQAAASAAGSLRGEFLAAATRLFEAAQARLGTRQAGGSLSEPDQS